MDIYIARQPIFDEHMRLYGYELLYRRSDNNCYEGADCSTSTSELVHNTFMIMDYNKLTDRTRGFINFGQELLEKEIPEILPKDKVVIEILETVEPTKQVIATCRRLKSLGFTLALDDFVLNRPGEDYSPLIELADIIKIEFNVLDKREQKRLLWQYGNKITFLAEKVETREEYQEAASMGYTLFQGYFFSKPVILKAREISHLNTHLVDILNELQKEEPDFFLLSDIIQKDLGLSYKLLKMSNSIYYGTGNPVVCLRQALMRIGIREMKRWVSIMLLKGMEVPETSELIKMCLLRGKVLALISAELKIKQNEIDFFLTGIFSSIDVILNDDMESILNSVAISQDVKNALIEKSGLLYECLNCVLKYEMFEFDEARAELKQINISLERYMDLYMEALNWLGTTDN
jgi:Predicted signal transduction protein containing EAL and modified HD-GYP domains